MKVDDLPASESARKVTYEFFRSLSPSQSQFQQRFFRRQLSLSTADQSLVLEWSPVTSTSRPSARLYAIALIDAADQIKLLITMPQLPEAKRINRAAQYSNQYFVQAECCQILAPLLEALQSKARMRLKAKIYFQFNNWPEPKGLTLQCHIKNQDSTLCYTGVAYFFDPDFLHDSFFSSTHQGKHNEWLHLPCSVRMECGSQVLRYRELKSLEPGDAIFLEEKNGAQKKTVLTLPGNTMRWLGELKNDGFHILAKEKNMPKGAGQGTSVIPGALMQDGSVLEDVDNIPVTISFSLGSYEKNFSEVMQLRPGYVLPLPAEFDHRQVAIIVNGKMIGSGELIVVGDRLAVQIEQWQVKHDT